VKSAIDGYVSKQLLGLHIELIIYRFGVKKTHTLSKDEQLYTMTDK